MYALKDFLSLQEAFATRYRVNDDDCRGPVDEVFRFIDPILKFRIRSLMWFAVVRFCELYAVSSLAMRGVTEE